MTGLCQTPSSFYPVVEFVRTSPSPDLALRYIILVGEALEFRRLTPWYQRYDDTAPIIANMYGPTETTVYVTYMALDRATAECDNNKSYRAAVPRYFTCCARCGPACCSTGRDW